MHFIYTTRTSSYVRLRTIGMDASQSAMWSREKRFIIIIVVSFSLTRRPSTVLRYSLHERETIIKPFDGWSFAIISNLHEHGMPTPNDHELPCYEM